MEAWLADDYISKPFSLREVAARVKAVLRRTRPKGRYDLVYKSRVFTDTYSKDTIVVNNAEKVIKGGTGYGPGGKDQMCIRDRPYREPNNGSEWGAARALWPIPEYCSVADRIRRVAGRVPRQVGTCLLYTSTRDGRDAFTG